MHEALLASHTCTEEYNGAVEIQNTIEHG